MIPAGSSGLLMAGGPSIATNSMYVGVGNQLARVISGGNRSKFTFSAFIKRDPADIGSGSQPIFLANNMGSSYSNINFWDDNISFSEYVGLNFSCRTSSTLADTLKFHHVCIGYDNAQFGTNKLSIEVDGVPWSYSGTASGPMTWMLNGYTHWLGGDPGGVWGPARLKFAEVWLVDGIKAPGSSFAQGTPGGIWLPKLYTDTTLAGQSFYLDFKDGSSIAAACFDKSGLGHHWTPTGMTLGANWSADHP